jgi:predicted RND superfamily exporter protein
MYYALATVGQLLVRGVGILAVMVEVMAFWRRIAKAVITLLAAAVIVGPAIGPGRWLRTACMGEIR